MFPCLSRLARQLALCALPCLPLATWAAPACRTPAQASADAPQPWLAASGQSSADGRRHYALSQSGHILALDGCTLQLLAQQSEGGAWEQLALSSDGRWLLAASSRRAELQVYDTELQAIKRLPVQRLDGRQPSGVLQLLDMPARRSFIVAFTELAELWELSYDPRAEPVFDGLVHDYRMGEGLAQPGLLHPRRTPLSSPATALRLAGDCCRVLVRPAQDAAVWDVIHLDVRRKVSERAAPAD
ncbi:cytochrome D1 domain-containing protein [Comamonas sp. NLF-1-9]|uniref:cytochrome D1 domain-containing protein n=1 Tax=Comamonas sp. NLF-1-9 TaxID=2853163 RepID=UPI001C485E59|nr:cytochrome D1 domain-containing protein [Comamonas sp. NLF-1-9]QXL84168.1 hypothetical protein KUD94_13205 [Comamonas sp. NLF-1-9]